MRKLKFHKTSNIVAFCKALGATKVELCQNEGTSDFTGEAKKPFFSIPEADIVGTVSSKIGGKLTKDLMISKCSDPNGKDPSEIFYLLHPAGERKNLLDDLDV